jgi:hypothetical protein
MNEPSNHPVGILLIEQDSALRKSMRKQLEGDGHAVLAVNSMGEALVRLRTRHYELVVCTNRHGSRSMSDDYGLLIDSEGLLARSAVGYEVYLPGIGIDSRAVLLMPSNEPIRVSNAVTEVWARLERTNGVQPSGFGGPRPASA